MPAVQKIDISSSTIFRTVLILLGFWFVYVARSIFVMLFGAFIIAAAIEPIVDYLARLKVPRALSVILVYLIVIAILSGFGSLVIEPISVQAVQLAETIPDALNYAADVAPFPLPHVDRDAFVESVRDAAVKYGRNVANVSANVFQGTRTVVGGFFTFVIMFVVALYMIVEKDAVQKFARLITPREHAAYVNSVVERAQTKVGHWVLGVIVLGSIVGTIIGVGLWALGVPYALLLGILAGVMEIMPVIGPIAAGVVGVAVALSVSPLIALGALILYVVTGLVESYVLIPNIMKRAVGLKPLATIIAVIIGAQLAGVLGIVLAVPIATILRIIFRDIFQDEKT